MRKMRDGLSLPGFLAPRITIHRQGSYHLNSAYLRAGSWWKGIYIVELDSLEKRISVISYSYAGMEEPVHDEDERGVAELYIGPRDNGDDTIFYSEDLDLDAVDLDNYTVVRVKLPRLLSSYIPARVRKLLRMRAGDWQFSIVSEDKKYGFIFYAYRYRW